MADYTEASSNASDALNSSSDGMVRSYTVSTNSRTVDRGPIKDQVEAAVMLEGLANRRSAGMFRVGKFREPRQ